MYSLLLWFHMVEWLIMYCSYNVHSWILSGEACVASSPATYPLEWWRSLNRCMLGTLLSFRWSKWQNSGCDWCWCLSTSGGASSVSFCITMHFFVPYLFSIVDFLQSSQPPLSSLFIFCSVFMAVWLVVLTICFF